jgi:hypothetical protein
MNEEENYNCEENGDAKQSQLSVQKLAKVGGVITKSQV